jgi:hypothetical protein
MALAMDIDKDMGMDTGMDINNFSRNVT